jgi:hypothetical protein
MEIPEKAIHVSISLTLNEDTTWSYRDPKVDKNIQFSVPAEMLTAKMLGDYIERAFSSMEKNWDKAVKEYEAEVAKEAAEKAAKEAAKTAELTPIDIESLLAK